MADLAGSIVSLVESLNRGELPENDVREVCQKISSKEFTLLSVIESLGPELVNAENPRRCRAVTCIARVVEALLPQGVLTDKEIELLTAFFCSKLGDHHSILPPTLCGLVALSSSHDLPSGSAVLIIQSIFREVHCQSQLQNDRRRIYTVIKNLLSSRLAELQPLGHDFVLGFIQAVDQERDPRNLLIFFSCVPVIAKYFKLEPLVEELFEVFSCYFPIDFTAPSDDPYGVTREQLVDGLHRCMASSTEFAQYCLPLLHSKLESDVESAKIDALKTLEMCCETYRPSDLADAVEMFWSSIRREVLINVNGEELEHAALDTLTALSRAFTKDNRIDSPVFSRVLIDVIKECKGHLSEPERRLMTPSGYILLAISAGSEEACTIVLHEVLPLLVSQYENRPQITPRQFIMHTLNKFIGAAFSSENVAESCMRTWSGKLIALNMTIVNSEEDAVLRGLALQGLAHFVPTCFTEEQLSRACEAVVVHLLDQGAVDDRLAEEVFQFFCKVSNYREDFAVNNVVPKLLEKVRSGGANHQLALRALGRLPQKPRIVSPIVDTFMDMLETYPSGSVVTGVLDALSEIGRESGHTLEDDRRRVLARLHLWALNHQGAFDEQVLQACSAALRNLSAILSPSDALDFASSQVDYYVKQWLQLSTRNVFIMEAALACLHCVVQAVDLERVISALESSIGDRSSVTLSTSACRLVAAFVNKLAEGAELEVLVATIEARIDALYSTNPECAFRFYVWLTKALVMKGYAKMDLLIEKLVGYLDRSGAGSWTAEGFAIVLSDTAECLNQMSHANIRLLYRQRFFESTVPRLLALYNRSSEPRAICFEAIANQLAHIPHGVLVSHMPVLLPMLVQCLAVDKPASLIISTTRALLGLIAENPTAVADQIDSLVPRLVVLGKDGGTMEVRKIALQCLGELSRSPVATALPLRPQVICRLVPCLDDKKRIVRREAVIARNKWIMLGQPGGR